MKDYASRRLDAASRREVEDRHSAHFLRAFRERVLEREIYFELAALRAEHENLVLVLDRALRRDPAREVDRRWALEAAILLEELGIAWGWRARGRLDEAIVHAGERSIDADTLAIALAHRAMRLALADGPAASTSDIDRALALEVDPKVRVRLIVLVSNFDITRGDYEHARPLLEEALASCVASGWTYMEGRVRSKLARVLHPRGARAEAIVHLERAVVLLSKEAEWRYALGVALTSLGTSHLDGGRPELAAELFERALALDEDAETQRGVLLVRLGVAAWMTGRADAAKRSFEEAIELLEALGESVETHAPWVHLALVHAHAGEVRKATRAVGAAIEALTRVGRLVLAPRRKLLDAHVAYAGARAARKKHGDASPATRAAHARARAALDEATEAVRADVTAITTRALALLAAAVEAWELERSGPTAIDRDGARFVLPGGEIIALEARPTLARVLEAIVTASVRAPGRPVEKQEIVEHAWAGERMTAESASSRVYVAVSTLRKLGLGEVLRRVEGGYLLDLSLVTIGGAGPERPKTT